MNELASGSGAAQTLPEEDAPVLGASDATHESPKAAPVIGQNSGASAEAVLEQSFDDEKQPRAGGSLGQNFEAILNIPVVLSMELGRTRINIRDLLKLGEGSVVQLDRSAGDPLDILVNDCPVARGEVVVVNERFGIRVTEILSPEERVRRIR